MARTSTRSKTVTLDIYVGVNSDGDTYVTSEKYLFDDEMHYDLSGPIKRYKFTVKIPRPVDGDDGEFDGVYEFDLNDAT